METTTEKKPKTFAEVLASLDPEYKKALGVGELLKRDQKVTFRTLQIPIVAHDTEGMKRDIYQASLRIPNTDSVWDGKNMVDISVPEEIMMYRNQNSEIVISGTQQNRFNLMYYLRMSNHNQSNPYAIKGSRALFEEVAYEAKALGDLEREIDIAAMIGVISEKNDAELSQNVKQLGIVCGESETEKKAALVLYIKHDANRQKFKNMVLKGGEMIGELVKKSKELGFISIDEDTKMWSIHNDGGEKMTEMYHTPMGTDPVMGLARYFLEDPKGKKQKSFLENKVDSLLSARRAESISKTI